MARDYKTRANPKPRPPRTSGWAWFFTGLALGLFIAGLAWLKLGPQAAKLATAQKRKPPEAAARATQPLPPKPRFDFYTVLPEMEVVVPEPEPSPAPRRKTEKSPRKPAPGAAAPAYMLQMGSFRRHEDADRMKASLALLGIQAEIQKVAINNRETYHRVRSGPYHDSGEIQRLRARLRQNGINSLLIRLKR